MQRKTLDDYYYKIKNGQLKLDTVQMDAISEAPAKFIRIRTFSFSL